MHSLDEEVRWNKRDREKDNKRGHKSKGKNQCLVKVKQDLKDLVKVRLDLRDSAKKNLDQRGLVRENMDQVLNLDSQVANQDLAKVKKVSHLEVNKSHMEETNHLVESNTMTSPMKDSHSVVSHLVENNNQWAETMVWVTSQECSNMVILRLENRLLVNSLLVKLHMVKLLMVRHLMVKARLWVHLRWVLACKEKWDQAWASKNTVHKVNLISQALEETWAAVTWVTTLT